MFIFQKNDENIKDTNNKVQEDRRFVIDSVLMTIMKRRKELAHSELMEQLFQELKFPVEVADVQKRIEGLIEKDYMKRNLENANVYEFVS